MKFNPMIFKCDLSPAWLGYVRNEVNIVSKRNENPSRVKEIWRIHAIKG